MRFKSSTLGSVKIKILKEKNPKTVKKLLEALPVKGKAKKWGKEIYFSVGLAINEEHSQESVKKGRVAYWPQGNAVCIFFGPTPASIDDKPRAAGPVNVFGEVSELNKFEQVKTDEIIKIVK